MKKICLFIGLIVLSFNMMAQQRDTTLIHDEVDSTLLEQIIYKDSKLIESTHYIYESLGELAVTIKFTYREDGVVDTRTLENYHNHLLMDRWQYTADEILLMEEHWKYDHQNRLISRKQTFYEGAYIDNLIEKRKYKGSICKVTFYLNNKLIHEYTDNSSK